MKDDWEKKEHVARVILSKHLALQPSDSPLLKVPMQELVKLVVFGIDFGYSYQGQTQPPKDITNDTCI